MNHYKDAILQRIGLHVTLEAEAVKAGKVDDVVEHRMAREELLEVMRIAKRNSETGGDERGV